MDEAKAVAERRKAAAYIECSARTEMNLKKVFDEAINVALLKRMGNSGSGRSNGFKCSLL